jgi:hypothetical protein
LGINTCGREGRKQDWAVGESSCTTGLVASAPLDLSKVFPFVAVFILFHKLIVNMATLDNGGIC